MSQIIAFFVIHDLQMALNLVIKVLYIYNYVDIDILFVIIYMHLNT